jgi:16S rRNA (adenine1518-N6/adenine1519-N6)-dimethyltransferase
MTAAAAATVRPPNHPTAMPPPRKRLGQHFLQDPGILRRIADAIEIAPSDTVLEIGPGPGGLTAELLRRAARVVAIEKDRDLVAALRRKFPRLSLIEGDALAVDWHALLGPGPFRIAGNIPYNITSPLIERALRPPRPSVVVYLVQREVADRVAAAPAQATYGALSVGVQSVARAERLFTIPSGAFRPRPRVESAVIRLRPLASPLISDGEVEPFRRFVVGLFSFRRKQLSRGLRELTGAGPVQAGAWLALAGIEESLRPEALPPASFVALFRAVGGFTGDP